MFLCYEVFVFSIPSLRSYNSTLKITTNSKIELKLGMLFKLANSRFLFFFIHHSFGFSFLSSLLFFPSVFFSYFCTLFFFILFIVNPLSFFFVNLFLFLFLTLFLFVFVLFLFCFCHFSSFFLPVFILPMFLFFVFFNFLFFYLFVSSITFFSSFYFYFSVVV